MSVRWTAQPGGLCSAWLYFALYQAVNVLLTCPDIIGFCNGLPIVTELKDDGTQTRSQSLCVPLNVAVI